MAEKILEINNLHVNYESDAETVYAVNGLNLSLEKGETLGLVGETGAGKTTTALSILKLLPDRVGRIVEGSVLFAGEDITAASESTMCDIRGNRISMIFQDPMTSLNPVHTVGKQIGEVLHLHRSHLSNAEIEERVDQMMTMVGLPPERKHEYPHQFSGGMKQRIVIAIALTCEPELLLADEPTTALDVTIQAQVLKLMKKLKSDFNTSMVMITHDLGVVAKTCDKVAVMYAGEVIEYGTLVDIFTGKDHHPYTTGLFGSIPNLTVKSRRLDPIAGLMPDPTVQQAGCRFAERCKHCMDICKEVPPQDNTVGTQTIRCRLFD